MPLITQPSHRSSNVPLFHLLPSAHHLQSALHFHPTMPAMRLLWVCVDYLKIWWIAFEPRGSSEACDAGTIEASECTKGDVCVSYYLRLPNFKHWYDWAKHLHHFSMYQQSKTAHLEIDSANVLLKIDILPVEGLQWIRPDQCSKYLPFFRLAKTLTRDCIPSDK